MDIENGRVVISRAGRDKGRFLAVIKTEAGKVYLCDGHERPLERPKLKNMKHIALTSKVLDAEDMAGNRALKRALKGLAGNSL